ncbi:Eco57I restriction-modification methylase domain-containing protein [Arcobacter porcinus]|uniref:site-specific DNA-methyltransferase (adenine-specific) n=1 Tax=Arcobacter porcinus TaxID=1935204 RepID=A0A5C2HEX1_9BACT|nr:N-6 DNA methylase [Arcobacter porcinus]OCL96864.1 Modification methylase PaeR7I [Aliarcobacter thereius]QEP40694.1 type IIG restriction/modification system [Arcobacter porcinus]
MFQNSVLKTFKDDEKLVAQRWAFYQNYKSKVEAIKEFKEEEYQDGFLKDIFENCLGYTLKTTNPSSFNLEREKKNETDSKKADAVIYINDEIMGVIELKAQDTKNLDKVQQQAFYYLSQHSKSKYVIISNFDELRFYIEKSTSYEKFNLFTLNYEDFKKLHLLISYESIKDDVPLKLKEKTNSFEQDISKKLYKDFSNFRTLLFENIVKNNLENETLVSSDSNLLPDKSQLLRLTQKLCDRIIFILFAEDRALLRTNMIKEIRDEFINQKFTNYSLYDIYKFYFDAINKGNERLDIPQYNGGLFAVDELLDSLIIDDFILDENVQILSNYDFASEISVNILGHIFEQSLTDLEELQANIDNVNFDKTKSKRKKDGVFYTPEYITRYIVENTLGKMCSEKREELLIGNGILTPSNPKKLTKQEQQTKDNLQEYKKWLLNLKILDPACGSGAFLNQALEYLISEHKNLQNDLALMGDLFASYMVEEEILENNLYGVDINEDAVEIAKLSLWLRTAKRGRALTKLADKIVCANSLLEMPFSENSFDVVIGNPPYVRQEAIKEQKEALSKIYKVYHGSADLYVYFVELGLKMIKKSGMFSYIFPNKWLKTSYGKPLRQFLKTYNIQSIIDFGDLQIFEGATTYPLILTISKEKQLDTFKSYQLKEKSEDLQSILENKADNVTFKSLSDDGWNIFDFNLLQKLHKNTILLDEYTNGEIFYGIKTGLNEAFVIDKNKKDEIVKKDSKSIEIIKPLLRGRDISKYEINFAEQYLIYAHNKINIEDYPAVKEHLEAYKTKLEKRAGKQLWWQLQSNSFKDFDKPKILYMEMQTRNSFCLDNKGSYAVNNKIYIYPQKDNYLLSILNSAITWYLISKFCTQIQNGYQISYDYLKQIPIPKIDEESQKPFIKLVDEILEAKQKIKDYKPLLDEAIKNNNFDREIALKKELENLENIFTTNEKTIDQMVYKLYDLTDDEIKIVENN